MSEIFQKAKRYYTSDGMVAQAVVRNEWEPQSVELKNFYKEVIDALLDL